MASNDVHRAKDGRSAALLSRQPRHPILPILLTPYSMDGGTVLYAEWTSGRHRRSDCDITSRPYKTGRAQARRYRLQCRTQQHETGDCCTIPRFPREVTQSYCSRGLNTVHWLAHLDTMDTCFSHVLGRARTPECEPVGSYWPLQTEDTYNLAYPGVLP